MRYMLLIVEPTGQREARSRPEGEQAYARMRRFGDELQAEGKLLAVESLALKVTNMPLGSSVLCLARRPA